MKECLSDLIILFAVVLVAGLRRQPTVSRYETLEFVASGHDQAEVRRGGLHWSCLVLWMVLDPHEIGMVWEGGGEGRREGGRERGKDRGRCQCSVQ